MPVIRVVDISKRFRLHHEKSLKERLLRRGRRPEDFWALRNVKFELGEGHTLGLIGPNGSGKTTLLKLIGGILEPTTGYVERRGRVAALLELGAGFHQDLTGRENVYLNASILGLTTKQTDRYFDDIVAFSGIEKFIDNQVKFYSSGMYVRLAFAVAVHVNPEILLVDEVLAVGDEPFQRKCMDRIRQFQDEGRTIIFVTHSLDLVEKLCDRVILLENGHLLVDGLPVEALEVFRKRHPAEGSEALSVELVNDDVAPIYVRDVRTTDMAGERKRDFVPGDSFGVDIIVNARERIEDWACGIIVNDDKNTPIFVTDNVLYGKLFEPIEGECRVHFTFGHLSMLDGEFSVQARLYTSDGTHVYQERGGMAQFRVVNETRVRGSVFMEFENCAAHMVHGPPTHSR